MAAIEDLGTRKIVGWAMEDVISQQLTLKALKQAYMRELPPKGLLHHSDRGSQYASGVYQDLVEKQGLVPSMSRRGNCYDNACAESFFSTLKCECIHLQKFDTKVQARSAIFDYIAVFYNRIRLHSSLGYRSPVDYERTIFTECREIV